MAWHMRRVLFSSGGVHHHHAPLVIFGHRKSQALDSSRNGNGLVYEERDCRSVLLKIPERAFVGGGA